MASLQKRLAASILKVGKTRVWINPQKLKDVEKAITRMDVKKLILQGTVKEKKTKIPRLVKKGGKRRYEGSREGSKYARLTSKKRWINTVRPLRGMLKDLKASGQMDNRNYKRMRLLVKGGMFRSRSHMRIYIEQHGLLKKK